MATVVHDHDQGSLSDARLGRLWVWRFLRLAAMLEVAIFTKVLYYTPASKGKGDRK